MIIKYDKMIFCILGVFWHPNDFTTFFDKKVFSVSIIDFFISYLAAPRSTLGQ